MSSPAREGWDVTEDAGRGFRRVVASPEPKGFVEIGAIRCLLDAGHVVVTGGGGGIPVGRTDEGWDGVDAVIDKDSAAAELAPQLQAEALVLITGVDAVQLDFGRPTQRPLTWAKPLRPSDTWEPAIFLRAAWAPRSAPPPGSSIGAESLPSSRLRGWSSTRSQATTRQTSHWAPASRR